MKCQEAEQKIQLFIDDELTGESLNNFVRHIDNCHSCYEEMETSYLLKEALSRLENGETFDLSKELTNKLNNMRDCLETHKALTVVRRSISVCAAIILVMSGLYILFTNYLL